MEHRISPEGHRKFLPRHMRGKRHVASSKEKSPAPVQPPATFLKMKNFLPVLAIGAASGIFAEYARHYSFHHVELFSSYGRDFVWPIMSLYVLPKPVSMLHKKLEWLGNPKLSLGAYTTFALGLEGIQYLRADHLKTLADAPRYDPWDFVALGL